MTGKQYSRILTPTHETLRKVRERLGDLEPQFRDATGYGFDALTESEARTLATFRPLDAVRARIIEEGHEGKLRRDGASSSTKPPVGEEGSPSSAEETTLPHSGDKAPTETLQSDQAESLFSPDTEHEIGQRHAKELEKIRNRTDLTDYQKNAEYSEVIFKAAHLHLSPERKSNPDADVSETPRIKLSQFGPDLKAIKLEKIIAKSPHELFFAFDSEGYLHTSKQLGPQGGNIGKGIPEGSYIIHQHPGMKGPSGLDLHMLFANPTCTMRIAAPVEGKRGAVEIYQLRLKEPIAPAEASRLVENYRRMCEAGGDTRESRLNALDLLSMQSGGKIQINHKTP